MFTRNLWLKVPLLFAVIGPAALFEALTHRQAPWWQVGIALIIGSVVTPLVGEWIAEDAQTPRGRRIGWGVAAGGALVHLVLDAACLSLPWIADGWRAGVAGAALGALVMGALLRRYAAALRDPQGLPPPPWVPSGTSWPARWWRGASLLGGNALTVMLIGLAFVAAALFVLIARPDARSDGRLWLGLLFFGACAVVGSWMGLERRAMLLGRPAPIRLSRLRLRRLIYVATADGLLCVDRRGATLYPWDSLGAVANGTSFHNPAVYVGLAPGASPRRIAGEEARWRRSEARLRALNRALFGVDLMLFTAQTETGPGPLWARLAEGLAEPEKRAALPSVEQEIARLRR